jgi:type II secretory pathway pseudopilin PulG
MSISRFRRRLTQRAGLPPVRRIVRAQRRRLAGDEVGLGMTEIIVAIMVFGLIATTAAYGMVNALTLTQYSRASETAMSIASSDLDQMRLTASVDDNGVFSVLSTNTPIPKTVGGTAYSITRQVSWQTTDGTTGACGTGTGTLQYKNVTETVSWSTKGGSTRSVTLASAIAPLSNINSDATGTIIVTVKGAGGQPVPGVTVSITPISGGGGSTLNDAPQNTDNVGCSFGLLVDPGSYAVTATLAGGIDINQNAIATTSGSVSVVAGQNAIVNFTYDQAATFPLTYPAGATLPTNLPISFYHATPGTTPFTATTPPPSVKAFPWGDGYTIIGGAYAYTAATSPASCLDTNPASWTTPRAGDNAVGVAPTPVMAAAGATAASTVVPLGTFTLSNIGTLAGSKYITAVTGTPTAGDPGCNAGQTITFARIPTGTSSLTLALPYGTWRLYAGSTAGSTTTALPSSGVGVIGMPLPGGVITSLGGGANSITLDPRVVTP